MDKKTDWTKYYSKPYKTAYFTRRITENRLIRLLKKFALVGREPVSVMELGGGESCFYERIRREIDPREYVIIDNNELALKKFGEKYKGGSITLIAGDVRDLDLELKVDVVFSVGLIEHFSVEDTKRAIATHFKLLKPRGTAIITFPTPTLLYRISRKLSESLGLWIFEDERPLSKEEVATDVKSYGQILYEGIIREIFLTQGVIVAKRF